MQKVIKQGSNLVHVHFCTSGAFFEFEKTTDMHLKCKCLFSQVDKTETLQNIQK